MGSFMTEHFPGRFFIHFGDSRVTVPQFVRANPTFRCDLIFVDGGHTSDVATADLENFVSICNSSNPDNAIIFDDYPGLSPWSNTLGRVWERLVERHSITELMRCMDRMKKFRHGFVIGKMTSNAFLDGTVTAQDSVH